MQVPWTKDIRMLVFFNTIDQESPAQDSCVESHGVRHEALRKSSVRNYYG